MQIYKIKIAKTIHSKIRNKIFLHLQLYIKNNLSVSLMFHFAENESILKYCYSGVY